MPIKFLRRPRVRRVLAWIVRTWRVVGPLVFGIGFLFLVVVSINALCLNSVQVNLDLGKPVGGVCKSISDSFLGWWGLDVTRFTASEYRRTVSTVLTLQMTLFSLYLVVVPFYTWYSSHQRLRRDASLRREQVLEDGVDDIRLMLQAYRNADRMMVFSGDFSWLADERTQNRELRKIVLDLARHGKVDLISYRTTDEIKRALEPQVSGSTPPSLFDELKSSFILVTGSNLKCSLILYGEENATFLYKDRGGEFGTEPFVVIARYSEESRGLLGALRAMIEQMKATGKRIP